MIRYDPVISPYRSWVLTIYAPADSPATDEKELHRFHRTAIDVPSVRVPLSDPLNVRHQSNILAFPVRTKPEKTVNRQSTTPDDARHGPIEFFLGLRNQNFTLWCVRCRTHGTPPSMQAITTRYLQSILSRCANWEMRIHPLLTRRPRSKQLIHKKLTKSQKM